MLDIARRGDPQEEPTPVEGARYTVLLLDEQQLDRLLARPHLKTIGSNVPRTLTLWPRTHYLKSIGVAAAAVVVAIMAVVWLRAAARGEPEATAAAVAPAPVVKDDSPAVSTGASFSVQVASFTRDAEARATANRLTKTGLAAYAWRLDGTQRNVLVGPYVSIDEAEGAQRSLSRQGYPAARLHVDERLRTMSVVPPSASVRARPAVVLVAAPGRLAIAFELEKEPQQVSGQRVNGTTFDIATSATGVPTDAQEWSAPADIQLIKHISLVADPKGTKGLVARVTVSDGAVAKVRLEGTRVYVDVSREQLDFEEARSGGLAAPADVRAAAAPVSGSNASAAPAARVAGRTPAPGAAAVPEEQPSTDAEMTRYRQAIAPVFARFEEIQPFVRTTIAQPTPEVLAAIAGTFGELEQTLRTTDVPRSALAAHGLLTSAVQLAKGAVGPSFPGDRMAQVREATAQFQAAKARFR